MPAGDGRTPDPALILQRLADAVVLIAPDGTVAYANDAFRVMVGRPSTAVEGLTWSDLAGRDTCARLESIVVSPEDGRGYAALVLELREGVSGAYAVTIVRVDEADAGVAGVLQVFRRLDVAAAVPRTEADQLRAALEQHRWNESRTARALGISRTTLWRRMRRFGLVDRT